MSVPTRVRLGQQIKLEIKSGVSGHLILFDLDALHTATEIAANADRQRKAVRRVASGETQTIELRVTEPVGKGSIIALVIPDETIASAVGGSVYGPQFSTSAYLRDLIREVSKTVTKSKQQGEISAERFAFARANIEIIP